MSIKSWFAKEYGSNVKDVNKMMQQIGYTESKNVATAVQKSKGGGEGPGRGLYQFETKGGSGAFQTALNRTESLYGNMKEEVPSWITEARKHDDASKLSVSQQQEVLLGDLAMKSGSNPLIEEALSTGSAKKLWLKKHWAGAEEGSEGYSAKGLQWDREMKTYRTDVAMDAIDKADKSTISKVFGSS